MGSNLPVETPTLSPSRAPTLFLLLTLTAAIAAPIIGSRIYTGEVIWPLVIGGFSASCLAFLAALAWDRHQRAELEYRETDAEQRHIETAAEKEAETRRLEACYRFSAIVLELERLQESLTRTSYEQRRFKHFFPDLPVGSFSSASVALGMIISNYGLLADLATFYGQVEELRWRLRHKALASTDEATMNPLIDSLASDLALTADSLIIRVREQVDAPDIERVPMTETETDTFVVSRRQLTGIIRALDPTPGDKV
jgi:hypothetical protein